MFLPSLSVTKFTEVDELFPLDCTVFMLGSPHYGAQGIVKEVDKDTGRIRVAFQAVDEPDLSDIIRDQRRLQLRLNLCLVRLSYLSYVLSMKRVSLSTNSASG